MIDLEEQFNFTNKLKHPTNFNKIVFRHYKQEQAEYFAQLLTEAGVEFEIQTDEEDARKPQYFGVARHLEKKVDRLNYLALGKGREKFIKQAPVRWFMIIVSLGLLLLAIIGALVSK